MSRAGRYLGVSGSGSMERDGVRRGPGSGRIGGAIGCGAFVEGGRAAENTSVVGGEGLVGGIASI
jgi:hypothetical protein